MECKFYYCAVISEYKLFIVFLVCIYLKLLFAYLQIVEEITRFLNLEKLIPGYQLCVTVSCLAAIRHLQKNGHLPDDSSIFKSYAVPGNCTPVRLKVSTCTCTWNIQMGICL